MAASNFFRKLNAMAYPDTAISTYSIGLLVQKYDWSITILTWLITTVLAGLICFTAAWIENKKSKKNLD